MPGDEGARVDPMVCKKCGMDSPPVLACQNEVAHIACRFISLMVRWSRATKKNLRGARGRTGSPSYEEFMQRWGTGIGRLFETHMFSQREQCNAVDEILPVGKVVGPNPSFRWWDTRRKIPFAICMESYTN